MFHVTRRFETERQAELVHSPAHVYPPGSEVPGLILNPTFLCETEQAEIVKEVTEAMSRVTPLFQLVPENSKARAEYSKIANKDRKMANVFGEEALKALPATYKAIQRVAALGFFPRGVNSLQINEYDAHQGCAHHVEAPSIGETMGMFSLLSPCVMELVHARPVDRVTPIPIDEGPGEAQLMLDRGSLLVLQSDARYKWEHGVRALPVVEFGREGEAGYKKVNKGHRFSLVFWRTLDADTDWSRTGYDSTVKRVPSGSFHSSKMTL